MDTRCEHVGNLRALGIYRNSRPLGFAEQHPQAGQADTDDGESLMPRSKRTRSKVEVETLRHNDTRLNIPTNELRDFAGDAELTPPTILYPRDPSLDPQLVWNGKDEQDGEDLK